MTRDRAPLLSYSWPLPLPLIQTILLIYILLTGTIVTHERSFHFRIKMRSPFVVASVFSLLLLARSLFTVFFIVPAFVCLTNDTTTETCGNAVFKQDTKNAVNMAGTLVEAVNSFLLVILIFRWEKFKVRNFLRAAPRLAVFWFWVSLFVVQAITVSNMEILSAITNGSFLDAACYWNSQH